METACKWHVQVVLLQNLERFVQLVLSDILLLCSYFSFIGATKILLNKEHLVPVIPKTDFYDFKLLIVKTINKCNIWQLVHLKGKIINSETFPVVKMFLSMEVEVEVHLICVYHSSQTCSILQGFLTVPIWWYQPQHPSGHWKSHQDRRNCTPSQGGIWRAISAQGENRTELQQPTGHKEK